MQDTYCRAHLEIPMHDSIVMAVMNALEDLLYTMGCVCLTVEFSGNDVLEEFATGDSAKKKNVGKFFVVHCTCITLTLTYDINYISRLAGFWELIENIFRIDTTCRSVRLRQNLW